MILQFQIWSIALFAISQLFAGNWPRAKSVWHFQIFRCSFSEWAFILLRLFLPGKVLKYDVFKIDNAKLLVFKTGKFSNRKRPRLDLLTGKSSAVAKINVVFSRVSNFAESSFERGYFARRVTFSQHPREIWESQKAQLDREEQSAKYLKVFASETTSKDWSETWKYFASFQSFLSNLETNIVRENEYG